MLLEALLQSRADGRIQLLQAGLEEVGQHRLDRQQPLALFHGRQQSPVNRFLNRPIELVEGIVLQGFELLQLLGIAGQVAPVDKAAKGCQTQQQLLRLRRQIAVGILDAVQDAAGLVAAVSLLVQVDVRRLQPGQDLVGGLALQVGQHHLHGQGIARQQCHQPLEGRRFPDRGLLCWVYLLDQDPLRQLGTGLRIQARQVVLIVTKGLRLQPGLVAAGTQQDAAVAADELSQELPQFLPFRFSQGILDRQGLASDRLQVVQHQHIATCPQFGHQFLLLRRWLHRLETGSLEAIVEPLTDLEPQLCHRPGSLVVAKVEDLLSEICRLPPLAQVVEQGGFAGAAHAPQQQHIVAQQRLLDLENLQIPPDKAVGGGREAILLLALGVVSFLLLGGKLPQVEADGPVAVDHRQQPILQIDALVEVGLSALLHPQLPPRQPDRLRQCLVRKQVVVELGHHQPCRRDGDRVAHGHHQLHASGHHAGGEAGFAMVAAFGSGGGGGSGF